MLDFAFCLIFLVLAGIAKAEMDTASDNGTKSKEWKNKWKLNDLGSIIPTSTVFKLPWWYNKFYKPAYIEKYPFSSTLFSCFTDTWHKKQFIFLRYIYASIACCIPFGIFLKAAFIFILAPFILGVAFEIRRKTIKI